MGHDQRDGRHTEKELDSQLRGANERVIRAGQDEGMAGEQAQASGTCAADPAQPTERRATHRLRRRTGDGFHSSHFQSSSSTTWRSAHLSTLLRRRTHKLSCRVTVDVLCIHD